MAATTHLTSMISEPLSWAEICKRFPDEWVCLVELDRIHAGRFAFRTARVVGHSKQRREAVEQSRPWWRQYEEIGQHFTGRDERVVHSSPRAFVRVDLPWNPVPRFYPCRDVEDAAAPSAPSKMMP